MLHIWKKKIIVLTQTTKVLQDVISFVHKWVLLNFYLKNFKM